MTARSRTSIGAQTRTRTTCGTSAQNHARAPAADHDVSLVRQIEDFLGRITREALAAGLQALEQRGAAFEQVMDGTLPHMQMLGDVMLDHDDGEQP